MRWGWLIASRFTVAWGPLVGVFILHHVGMANDKARIEPVFSEWHSRYDWHARSGSRYFHQDIMSARPKWIVSYHGGISGKLVNQNEANRAQMTLPSRVALHNSLAMSASIYVLAIYRLAIHRKCLHLECSQPRRWTGQWCWRLDAAATASKSPTSRLWLAISPPQHLFLNRFPKWVVLALASRFVQVLAAGGWYFLYYREVVPIRYTIYWCKLS